MDYIRVFGIPAHNRNSRDRAELNGVTDLVIADNTPFTIIIVSDLFIQRWLSALRLDSDILDNLQNVVGKNFACSYISILDQIITGCQTCDGIRACTCSKSVKYCATSEAKAFASASPVRAFALSAG